MTMTTGSKAARVNPFERCNKRAKLARPSQELTRPSDLAIVAASSTAAVPRDSEDPVTGEDQPPGPQTQPVLTQTTPSQPTTSPEDQEDEASASESDRAEEAESHPTQEAPAEDTPVTEAKADIPGYVLTEADKLLDLVYGDHLHDNDGLQLTGGVADDHVWQHRWQRIFKHPQYHYSLPSRGPGKRFVRILTNELQGVRTGKWNSERPLVFIAVVLQKTAHLTSTSSKDIKPYLAKRLDLWEAGRVQGASR